VITVDGRKSMVGHKLSCEKCGLGAPVDRSQCEV